MLSQGALVTEMTGLQAAVPQPGEYRVLSYLPMAHIAERLLSIYGMLDTAARSGLAPWTLSRLTWPRRGPPGCDGRGSAGRLGPFRGPWLTR